MHMHIDMHQLYLLETLIHFPDIVIPTDIHDLASCSYMVTNCGGNSKISAISALCSADMYLPLCASFEFLIYISHTAACVSSFNNTAWV